MTRNHSPADKADTAQATPLESEPPSRVRSFLKPPTLSHGESAMGFVQIFLSSPTPMSILRLDTGRYVDVNDAFLELFGCRRAQLIGRPPSGVGMCEPSFLEGDLREQLYTHGFLRTVELACRTVDGDVRTLATTCQVMELGGEECVLVVQEDVTESQRTRVALQASEEQFRAVFDGASAGIVITDTDDRIILYNRASKRVLEHGSEGLIGKAFSDLLQLEDRAKFEAWLQSLHQGAPSATPVEVRANSAEHSQKTWLSINASTIQDGGVPRRVLLIDDITERMQLKVQLELSSRLASLGTLSAGVAHEINNPLAYISANLDYVLEELTRAKSHGFKTGVLSELIEATREARSGAERVRHIVRDLKTFSRQNHDQEGPCSVKAVLESALNLTRNELKHRAEVECDLPSVGEVRGSESRLAQVFINLLVNAAQALPDRPITENRIVVRLRELPHDVEVTIEDNGIGIPADTLSRIFDPFYTTKPVGVGTGLGLSICHGIIQTAGGEISAESVLGAGSVFRVRLPKAGAAPRGSTEPAPERQ